MTNRPPRLSSETLAGVVEGILFVAEAAVEIPTLARALQRSRGDVEAALKLIDERFSEGGIRLQRDGERVQLVTAPEVGPYVEQFLGVESRQRLSGAALESLAIVAYKQPVTRAGIESVRGVNSDSAIASLIARGLVQEVGKAPGPGRPALLGTTLKFLEHFGLKDASELPPLPAASATNGSSGLATED